MTSNRVGCLGKKAVFFPVHDSQIKRKGDLTIYYPGYVLKDFRINCRENTNINVKKNAA